MLSVIQLEEECDRLLKISENYDRIDVYTRVNGIKDLCSSMMNAYNAKVYVADLVNDYKSKLNRSLIEFETILCRSDCELKERNDERVRIFRLKKWYADHFKDAVINKSKDELLEFCLNMYRVSTCYRIVSDIVYTHDNSAFSTLVSCEDYCREYKEVVL